MKQLLENKIRTLVSECVAEEMLKHQIDEAIRSVLLSEKKSNKHSKAKAKAKSKSSSKGKSKKASTKKQSSFRDLLNDPTIDLAQVAYAVDGGNPDSVRSKWSKKARGERPFTSKEITQGTQIIRQMQS